MGASLRPASDLVSDLVPLPLFSFPTVFFFLLPFSFLFSPYFLFNPTPNFSPTHTFPLASTPPPIAFLHPQPFSSISPGSVFLFSLLTWYHGEVFVAVPLLRDFSRFSLKIGRASARVHAPPPSLFYFMGLLTLMVLGFCPDLLRWLQIPCYCAKFGNIDESVSSSFFLFSFYNFRVILFGLWFRDLSASHDFVASCSNLAVSITVVCGFAGFLAAREAEKISVRIAKQVPDAALSIEREGHTHGFCCTEAGSLWVAEHVASLIKNKVSL